MVLAPDEVEDPAALAAAAGTEHGVDVAFEAAGTNDAVERAVAAVRPGGRVVLAGIPDDDRTTLSASVARRKGLTIAFVRRMKDVYPRAVQLVERGRVDVASLVTARYPLERVTEAFEFRRPRGDQGRRRAELTGDRISRHQSRSPELMKSARKTANSSSGQPRWSTSSS